MKLFKFNIILLLLLFTYSNIFGVDIFGYEHDASRIWELVWGIGYLTLVALIWLILSPKYKKNEFALRIFDNLSDSLIIVNRRGKILLVADHQAVGISKFRNKKISELIFYTPELENELQKLFQSKMANPVEFFDQYLKMNLTLRYLPKSCLFWSDAILIVISTNLESKNLSANTVINEEKFSKILNAIQDAVITTDSVGIIEMANTNASNLTGYSADEMIGKSVYDIYKLIDDRKGAITNSAIKKTLQNGYAVEDFSASELICKDGSTRRILSIASPIKNFKMQVTGGVLAFRDVSSNYLQQTKLDESNNALATAAELANLVYFKEELDSNRIEGSRNLTKFWATHNHHAVSPKEWVYPDDLADYERKINFLTQDLIGKVTISYRSNYYGSMRYFRQTTLKKPDENFMFGIIQDVTELVESQLKIADNNILLQELFDNLPISLALKDADDNFKYLVWNRDLENLSGLSAKQVIGKTDEEINRPFAMGINERDKEVFESDSPLVYTEKIRTASNKELIVRKFKSKFKLSTGKNILMVMGHNITQEEELKVERENIIDSLNDYISSERVINQCLHYLALESKFENLLKFMLQLFGKNLGANHCAFYQYYADEEVIAKKVFEWLSTPELNQLQESILANELKSGFEVLLKQQNYCVNLECIDAESFLWHNKLASLIMAPVFAEGEILGFLVMDLDKGCVLSDCDLHMINSFNNLCNLALKRDKQAAEINHQNEFMHVLLNQMPAFICAVNPAKNNKISMWNKVAEEWTQEKSELVINTTIKERIRESAKAKIWLDLVNKANIEGKVEIPKLRYAFTDSFVPLLNVKVYKLNRVNMEPIILIMAVDITKAEKQQLKLEEQSQLLITKNKLLEELIEKLNNYVANEKIINSCLSQIVMEENFADNLNAIFNAIAGQINCERIFWATYPKDSEGKLSFVINNEWSSTTNLRISELIDENYYQQMLLWHENFIKGESIKISNIHTSNYSHVFNRNRVRSFLAMPVLVNDELIGVLVVNFVNSMRKFSDVDEEVLYSAANIVLLAKNRDLQKQQLDLVTSENRLILNHLNTPIWLYDHLGKLIRVNPEVMKITGYSEAELLMDNSPRLFVKDSNVGFETTVERALDCKNRVVQNVVINDLEFIMTSDPICNQNGDIIYILKSAFDVTEINKNKRELEQAIGAAQAADRAKSYFLATMSHELKTPLNAIIGFSELLQNNTLGESELHDYVGSINSASNALLGLINNVLDYSKLEANQMQIIVEKCNMANLCRELKSIYTLKANDKGLAFKINYSDDLPYLYLDGLRLKQVLLNIINNAIKFTEKGDVIVNVNFKVESDNKGDLFISIEDSGIGISDDFKDKLFSPFSQENNIRGAVESDGPGLGLAIAKKIINNMNGDIKLDSQVGVGSCFAIKIAAVRYEYITNFGSKTSTSSTEITMLNHSILVVDDVMMNRNVLSAIFKRLKATIQVASSGEEALKILDSYTPQVILTDMWMPNMNGAEFATKVRQRYGNDIIIYAVTADTEINTSFDMSMFDGIIFKPVTIDKLKKIF